MAQQTAFQAILDSLQDPKNEFPRAYLQHFSDIDPVSLKSLMALWPRLKLARNLSLVDGFLSLMDSNTLVWFEDIGRALLDDAQSEVRARALRLLAESDDPR